MPGAAKVCLGEDNACGVRWSPYGGMVWGMVMGMGDSIHRTDKFRFLQIVR